jgi:hypothetical protein
LRLAKNKQHLDDSSMTNHLATKGNDYGDVISFCPQTVVTIEKNNITI